MFVTYDDTGPDGLGRRHYTLEWAYDHPKDHTCTYCNPDPNRRPTTATVGGFIVHRRAQCFHTKPPVDDVPGVLGPSGEPRKYVHGPMPWPPKPDPYADVTVRTKAGSVVGPVCIHGAGGAIRYHDRARFEHILARATEGEPLGNVYEPEPGHVWAYVMTAAGPEKDERDYLDLRGAELLAWDRHPG
jgi:hypothetical protein